MNAKKRGVAAAFFCCSVMVAMAQEGLATGPSAGALVYLEISDDSSDNVGSFKRGDNWSDGEVPSAAHDYLVSGGRNLNASSAANSSFEGRSLQIGTDQDGDSALLLFRTPYWDTEVVFANQGLRLVNGRMGTWNACRFTVDGPVWIGATEPFGVFGTGVGASAWFKGPVSGPAEARLRIYSREGDAKQDAFVCGFSEHALDEYYGEIVCARYFQDEEHAANVRAAFRTDGGDFPGSLVLQTNTSIIVGRPTANFRVSNLRFHMGAEYHVDYDAIADACGCVEVLGTYEQEGLVRVCPSTSSPGEYNSDYIRRWPILKVVAGNELSVDGFELDERYPTFPSFELVVEVGEDGSSTLYLVQSHRIMSLEYDDGYYGRSFDSGSCWWDRKSPMPERDYIANKELRTADDAGCYVFGGHSLALVPNVEFITRCAGMRVDDLRVIGRGTTKVCSYSTGGSQAGQFAAGALGCTEVAGRITIGEQSTLQFYPQRFYSYAVGAEICGFGNVEATSSYIDGAGFGGYLGLFGMNTNFYGRVKVKITDNVPSWNNTTHLFIKDSRNLGAPLPHYTYDALHLAGNKTTLHPVANMTLDDATRGMYLEGECGIDVTNDVFFTINERLHFKGVVSKFGTGVLSLGGPEPCFPTMDGADPSSPNPQYGYNELRVENGGLRPGAYRAFNGLCVKFGVESRLLLDIPETNDDGGLGQFGMYNTKWEAPLVAPPGGIKLELCNVHEVPRKELKSRQVPICTVTSTAADGLRNGFQVPRAPYEDLGCEIRERTNADSTVTFFVSFKSERGMPIFIR